MAEWLERLKAGDEVIIQSGEYGHRLLNVERVTPAQIVIGRQRFWRVSGVLVGLGPRDMGVRLTEPTPERKAKILRNETMRRLVQDVKWSTLTDGALAQIVGIIEGENGFKPLVNNYD